MIDRTCHPRWTPFVLAPLFAFAACRATDAASAAPTEEPDGGSTPPDAGLDCPAGEAEIEGRCTPPGVPAEACPGGFRAQAEGCTAIVPASPCPPGQMAVPGDAACREIIPCPDARYGDAPETATTQHVDGSYGGNDSDGSASRPWTTISRAIQVAPARAVIAIAAGRYPEAIRIDQPLRLWGRCPKLVTIHPPADSDGVYVNTRTSESVIQNVAVEGRGITAAGAHLLVENVHVHDTTTEGFYGLSVGERFRLVVRNSLVERSTLTGFSTRGGLLEVERTQIRDVLPHAHYRGGRGFSLGAHGSDPTLATIRRVLVERCPEFGIEAIGGHADVFDSLIRDVGDKSYDQSGGVIFQSSGAVVSSGTVERSVVENILGVGIDIGHNADVTVKTTSIRGTRARNEKEGGTGLSLYSEPQKRPQAVISRSLVETSERSGVLVYGGRAELDSVLIRATGPDEPTTQAAAPGLLVFDSPQPGTLTPTVTFRDSVVTSSYGVGIHAQDAPLELDHVVVSNTRTSASVGASDGIVAVGRPDSTFVRVSRSRIVDNARLGIGSWGALVQLSNTALECSPIFLSAAGEGTIDLGVPVNSHCGCAELREPCVLDTSQVPQPLVLLQ